MANHDRERYSKRNPKRSPERQRDFDRGYDTEGYYGEDYEEETDYSRGYYQVYGGGRRSGYGARYNRQPAEYDYDYKAPSGSASGAPNQALAGGPAGGRNWGDFGGSAYYPDRPARRRQPWEQRGRYTGFGPQGYSPDERITEEVNARLTHHGQLDARKIEVETEDRQVTLRGTVDSRRAKRSAEDTAASVPGVIDVHNRLRIPKDEA